MNLKVLISIGIVYLISNSLFGQNNNKQNLFKHSQKVYQQYPDSSLQIIQDLIEETKSSEDKYFSGNLYYWQGKTLLMGKQDMEQALVSFYNALNCFEFTESQKDIANTLTYIGSCYRRSNNYKLSLESYNEEISIRQNLKDSVGLYSSYLNIGIVYIHMKMYDSAYSALNKSLHLSRLFHNNNIIMKGYTNLGTFFLNQDQIDSALYYYNLSLPLAQNLQDTLHIARLYGNIGACHLKDKQFKKARLFFNQALPLNEKYNAHNAIYTYYDLGELNQALGREDSAIYYFNKATSLNPEKTELPIYKKAIVKLISHYEEQNNISIAFDYSKKLNAVNTVHFEKLEAQEEQFKAYKTERIYIQHQNQQLKFENLRLQEKQLMLLISIIMALTVVSALILYAYKLYISKRALRRTVDYLKEKHRFLMIIRSTFNLDFKHMVAILNRNPNIKKFKDI